MVISRLSRVAGPSLLAASLLLALEGTAKAGWFTYDEFESNPSADWFFHGGGSYTGQFVTSTYSSPTHSAKLTSTSGSWSAIGSYQTVWMAGVCEIEFMVKTTTTQNVNVEVIDPASWTYISLRTVSVSSGAFRLVTGNTWSSYYGQDVVVRLAIGGSTSRTAYVDDWYIWCD
jgi:hypothetical protein